MNTPSRAISKRLPPFLMLTLSALYETITNSPTFGRESVYFETYRQAPGRKPSVERRRTALGGVAGIDLHHPSQHGSSAAAIATPKTVPELRSALGGLMVSEDLGIVGLAATLEVNANTLGVLMRGQYKGTPRAIFAAYQRYQAEATGKCRVCGQQLTGASIQ
jgi:hypothetical protein